MMHLEFTNISILKPIAFFENERYLQFNCGGTEQQTSDFVVPSSGQAKIDASFDFDLTPVSGTRYLQLRLFPTKAFGTSLVEAGVEDRGVGQSFRLNLDKMEKAWREANESHRIWRFKMALANKKTTETVANVTMHVSFDIPVTEVIAERSSNAGSINNSGLKRLPSPNHGLATEPKGKSMRRLSSPNHGLATEPKGKSVRFVPLDPGSDSDDVKCDVKTYYIRSKMRKMCKY